MKLSIAEAWRLQNKRSKSAAPIEQIELAIRLSFLFAEIKYSTLFSEYNLNIFQNSPEDYQNLLDENSLKLEEGENPGLKVFKESFTDLNNLISETSDKEIFFGEEYKDRFETILAYYPEYAWLKRNYMEIPGGADIFEELSRQVKYAFEKAGVQGRFSWNIST